MSVFNYDNEMPGVLMEVEPDYSYGFDTSQWGTTDSVLIIGTAFSGPAGQVTQVYSPEHAAYIFGTSYDTEKDQEATLVAGVQDAWDRGCRTIYAIRVGGKDMYKDFDFCIDSNYKLRVSAMFPSNDGKKCYLKYDNTVGLETLRFYKPANRATISEKRQGYVTSASAVLATELRLNQDYGYNRDSSLVDVIKMFNTHPNNNVIKLTIVDKDGQDVTNSGAVRKYPLGVLYPGVYFIGRDQSICTNMTEQSFHIISETSGTKPFTDFNDTYYSSLNINTDVTQPLPIYAKDMSQLRTILHEVDITMAEDWDFLDNTEIPDRAFIPDSVDYEEADISGFELYQLLGSGFATTAKAEKRVDATGKELTPRIKETPMDDSNHTVPIVDGIYSMLQDAQIKYRVLTCATADEKITGKLPRAAAFQKAIPQEVLVLKDYVKITPKINADSKSEPKEYTFRFAAIDNPTVDNIKDIYSKEVFPVIGSIESLDDLKDITLDAGTMLMVVDPADTSGGATLIRVNSDGSYSVMNGNTFENQYYIVDQNLYVGVKVQDNAHGEYVTFSKVENLPGAVDNKEYLLGDILNHVFVYQLPTASDTDKSALKPLGDLKTMLEAHESPLILYAENLDFTTNQIVVKSTMFDNITMEELVDELNNSTIFGQLFSVELTSDGSEVKDEFVSDVLATEIANDGQVYTIPKDRVLSYDYDMYIPYRTTDNFARQFAQHCTYTELRTTPTFGIIGCERISNISLSSVSKKVSKLIDTNFDLYAKNNYGRNLLDRNNLPYPIGKNLSITFVQYDVNLPTDSYYTFISNGAAGYAGMVSTLPLDQSSTNQPIAVTTIYPSLTQSQLAKLTAKGIVTLRGTFTRGIVVTDGITMAPADSVFRRLSASRIIGAVEDLIRQAAEPYIGKQNHSANRNALHTAIDSKLSSIQGTLIEEYEFNLIVDPSALKFAYINIDYNIVPIYEIREIRNVIRIKDSLS